MVFVTWIVIVFIPSLEDSIVPLLLVVCLWSVASSVPFKPTLPSLNVEYTNTSGYAVSSDPSLFKGTLPNVLVMLNVGRPLVFKTTLSLERLSLAFWISKYLVSLLTISYPLMYA